MIASSTLESVMTKYTPLANHLAALSAPKWVATFDEIEAILGFALPRSAHLYPAWWANQTTPGHSQNQGWRPVRWRTADLDLAGKKVTFSFHVGTAPSPDAGQSVVLNSVAALSIAQAKLGLARYYEVPPERVGITIRG
jgi:hypothetical protein